MIDCRESCIDTGFNEVETWNMTTEAGSESRSVDSDAVNEPEFVIGERLRACRQQQRLSLKSLSERSQLSIGMLSQIERGISTPSLRTLSRLRTALGVPLSELLGEQPNPTGTVVLRRGEGRQLDFPDLHISKRLVSPGTAQQVEMMLIHLEPGGSSGPEPYSHEGEECGYVLEGQLTLIVSNHRYEIRSGDTFQFASELPHRFENTGRTRACVLWIVTPPFYGRQV